MKEWSYLRRTAHHQLDEVPAASFGCVDLPHRLQAFQGAVLRQAADQHGPLGPFGHPAGSPHLLAAGRLGLVLVEHADHRGRLAPPSLPQLHLPSSGGRRSCLVNRRSLIGIWQFVVIQAVGQRSGSVWMHTQGRVLMAHSVPYRCDGDTVCGVLSKQHSD